MLLENEFEQCVCLRAHFRACFIRRLFQAAIMTGHFELHVVADMSTNMSELHRGVQAPIFVLWLCDLLCSEEYILESLKKCMF